jgi:hypothetical protein
MASGDSSIRSRRIRHSYALQTFNVRGYRGFASSGTREGVEGIIGRAESMMLIARLGSAGFIFSCGML